MAGELNVLIVIKIRPINISAQDQIKSKELIVGTWPVNHGKS
jgi:hypothetical protein